jgi:hypothetical protein
LSEPVHRSRGAPRLAIGLIGLIGFLAAGWAPPAVSPATAATLVGAGDIGRCGSDRDEATARIIRGIGGTVFTAGDNA